VCTYDFTQLGVVNDFVVGLHISTSTSCQAQAQLCCLSNVAKLHLDKLVIGCRFG
jgi:hypothetical protein